MNEEQEKVFAAVAQLLGATAGVEEQAEHICRYRLNELEFYFTTDWRDQSKGGVRATKPKAWGPTHEQGPRIGFTLSRAPEAIARDIQRRWLEKAKAWHWQKVAEKNATDQRETEERFAIEALMQANGCGFTYEEAMREACGYSKGDNFRGHGIEFNRYDLRTESYHGFRMKIEVWNEAALRMIARIAGEDHRMHHTETEDYHEHFTTTGIDRLARRHLRRSFGSPA